MRSALVLASSFLTVIACTGGPGSPDQGGDPGDQNGTVTKDGTGGSVNVDTTPTGSGTVRNNPPPDIRATDYDQSCNADTDCQAIQQGSVCTTCLCSNAAIASKDSSKYQSDKSSRIAQCDPSSFTGGQCACASTQRAQCDTGSKKCVFR